jgi:hypothetical protein
MESSPGRITCATYTHARRHPLVIGKIGDWTPPFQFTLPQLGVFLAVLYVEAQTWRYWGHLLPQLLGVLTFLGLPVACAWAVRKARWEGRSLPRAVLGWMTYATLPRRGQASGRTYRHPPARALHGTQVYVMAGRDTALRQGPR